jgi:antitoxin (DNA-binding transcriptional repressor) of toxin-antitoxin stability system
MTMAPEWRIIMTSISIEEAQAKLPQLIEELASRGAIFLTRDRQPIALLTAVNPDKPQPILGRCKGMLTIVSEDDEHLQDWAEYME